MLTRCRRGFCLVGFSWQPSKQSTVRCSSTHTCGVHAGSRWAEDAACMYSMNMQRAGRPYLALQDRVPRLSYCPPSEPGLSSALGTPLHMPTYISPRHEGRGTCRTGRTRGLLSRQITCTHAPYVGRGTCRTRRACGALPRQARKTPWRAHALELAATRTWDARSHILPVGQAAQGSAGRTCAPACTHARATARIRRHGKLLRIRAGAPVVDVWGNSRCT